MTRIRQSLPILLGLAILFLVIPLDAQQTQSEPSRSADQGNTTAASRPLRVRVSQGGAAGLLVKRVAPEYSKDLRKKRIQGMVTLKILISREGEVSEAALVSGHPTLGSAAIDAVKQWKFKPYLLDGQPVEVETTVQINFTLAGG